MSVESSFFAGRIGIIQRTLPEYRAPFFDTLAAVCTGGLSLLAGQPLPSEAMATANHLNQAVLHPAQNRHFLNPSSPFYLCWQNGVPAWLENWQPDVLIVEANPRYLSSPGAIAWMHQRGRPVLGWGLGAPTLTGVLGRIQQWQRSIFLRTLDGIIAYSQRGADQYHAEGFPTERIFIAHNAATPRPTHAFTEPSLLSPGDRPVVLFVGRLQQRKRLDLLLRACAELPSPLQPHLRIVGDGPARAEFENLARNVYPSANFLGGLYGADLESVFTGADLFVLPGTGGLAIQQAMGHGLPVIAAEADGTQGDLVRPESGWQVPSGDLESLRRIMADALSDLPRLRRMGRAAYRIVSEEINLETMAATFVQAAERIRHLGNRS